MAERKYLALTDIYEFYKDRGGELDWNTFKIVCGMFNETSMDRVINHAESLELGGKLGSISILRIKRRYKNPAIDWAESYKLKKEIEKRGGTPYSKDDAPDGEKWFVYFTSDWYCRFYWRKAKVGVRGQRRKSPLFLYTFHPTRGKKGNKKKLSDRLKKDSTAHVDYDQMELNWT